jgi:hypothetical protein
MGAQLISQRDALDRVLTAFSVRGWRDDGSAAQAVVAAATRNPGPVDLDRLVRAVPRPFLRNNSIARKAARAAIAAALSGVQVAAAQTDERAGLTINTTNNQRITIQNSGPWAGNVGIGGDISGVNQIQQMVGDVAIQALADRYGARPEVQQILESAPPNERHPRLTGWLRQIGAVGVDIAPQLAAELIKRYLGS